MAFAKKNSKPSAVFSCTPTKPIKKADSVHEILRSMCKTTPDLLKSVKVSPVKQNVDSKPAGSFLVPEQKSEIDIRSKRPLRRSQSAHCLHTGSSSAREKTQSHAKTVLYSPRALNKINTPSNSTDILNRRIAQSPSTKRFQSPCKTGDQVQKQESNVPSTSNKESRKVLTISNSIHITNYRSKKPCEKQEAVSDSSENTPLSHRFHKIKAQFEKKAVPIVTKPPPSPSPVKRNVRFVEPKQILKTKDSPRVAQQNIRMKGILNCKINDSSPLRTPVKTTPIKSSNLKRSVSAQDLTSLRSASKYDTPTYTSSISKQDLLTPKHFRLQDNTPDCYSPVLLETPSSSRQLVNDVCAGESSNLTVGVRIRPSGFLESEAVYVEGNTVNVEADSGGVHCFEYDHCFVSSGPNAAGQEEIFNTLVLPLVGTSFEGYNVCLFAYGQTGSGKSYSMMGLNDELNPVITDRSGIIPRFCHELFRVTDFSQLSKRVKIEISYFEIYNEKIHDLLAPTLGGRREPLRVREHPVLGPYVVNLTTHEIHSFETVMDWLRIGEKQRASAATAMNENSSRSHSIFSITLTQSQSDSESLEVPSLCSKINLVDLAGSERISHMTSTAERLKESVSINKSLLTLGKVISSLSEKKKRGFIPYRESILTWLLRESLGGNSKTVMLATVSPGLTFVDETLSTLRYACQARNIVNTVRINESAQEKRIRELSEEVKNLQQLCQVLEDSRNYQLTDKISTLENELCHMKEELGNVYEKLDKKNKENVELQGTNRLLKKKLELQKLDYENKLSTYYAKEEESAKKYDKLTTKLESLEQSLFELHEREEEAKPLLEQLRKLNIICPDNKENTDEDSPKPLNEEKDLLNPSPEYIYEALKEAADVCSRLRLPYVFHPEPEVTTQRTFNINVRVTDKTELSSVRWSQTTFLNWLQTMKDDITSSSRGRILFKDSEWIKRAILQAVPLTPLKDSGTKKKDRPLREEVTNLKSQIASLENLCQEKDRREVTTAINTLVDALNNLSLSLGVRTPSKGVLLPIILQEADRSPRSNQKGERTFRRNMRLFDDV